MNSKRLSAASRMALGLVFVVFDANFFLHFLPQPPAPPAALAFAGALLLSRVAVPFALVLLAPIIVNIVAFHALLAPSGLPLALFVLAAELHQAWVNRRAFAPLFARAKSERDAVTAPHDAARPAAA